MLNASSVANHVKIDEPASASSTIDAHSNPVNLSTSSDHDEPESSSNTLGFSSVQKPERVSVRNVIKNSSQEFLSPTSSRSKSKTSSQFSSRGPSSTEQGKQLSQAFTWATKSDTSDNLSKAPLEQNNESGDKPTTSLDLPGVPNHITSTTQLKSNKFKAKRPTSSRPSSFTPDEPPKKKIRIITAPPGTIELQTSSCLNSRYLEKRRCSACISKKTGEPCRFKGIRAFKVDNDGKPADPPVWYGFHAAEDDASIEPVYNEQWCSPIEPLHIKRIKTSVARVLLPVLKEERRQLRGKESSLIRRKREMDVRVTCDRCLTSIFATSFLCTLCGREICLECHSTLERLEPSNSSEIRLTACGPAKSGTLHTAADFLPVCRFDPVSLDDTIEEMQKLLDEEKEHAGNNRTFLDNIFGAVATTEQVLKQRELHQIQAADNLELEKMQARNDTHMPQSISTIASLEPSPPSPASSDSSLTPLSSEEDVSDFKSSRSKHRSLARVQVDTSQMTNKPPLDVHKDPANLGSLPYKVFHRSHLTEESFRSLWQSGQTMVVTDLLSKMKIKWTPEYFIKHYGSQECSITDCDNEVQHKSTVKDFFSDFGQYAVRGTQIHKLKDWPPSADFKTAFPSLFDDFHRAVPASNYTRRDGFYNIAAHFPVNVVAPDMGPKMYNAFASRENGFGSTRLHMDMADAVNIMLYAAPLPGKTQGVAVWDIYPATDSHRIRVFLKEEFPLETSPIKYVDPIHSQYFYLTPALRQKLYAKYKVRSWRIYQKPGDAVFIPAGCAHQVCNLADCIKVAVDFVSPENLDRCGQLTKEFRSENDKVIWKEDILQLSNMCWSAWENTSRLERQS